MCDLHTSLSYIILVAGTGSASPCIFEVENHLELALALADGEDLTRSSRKELCPPFLASKPGVLCVVALELESHR